MAKKINRKLGIREIFVLETIKRFNKINGEEITNPVYEGILIHELPNYFPKNLLPTTIAALIKKGAILKTIEHDTKDSILQII